MASLPLIPNGTYRIRSKNLNLYLDCAENGSVAMQKSSPGASQQWTISPAAAGDYEIKSQAGALRVNNQNHLFCSVTGEKFTWTIEPRESNLYVIGNAANAQAIQLPRKECLVMVAIRNNGARQRWLLEPNPASVSGGCSDGNMTGPLFAGVFAVPGFTWKVEANLRSITDLPIATQMMARGPDGSWTPTEADFEAFQVARWALGCFVQSAVPITHPGGRGNYDALRTVSLGGGWVGPYVFQRLLDIAILHPATRAQAVPIIHPVGAPGELPSTLQNATSSWNVSNRNLFSFCFRLHEALLRAGAIVNGSLSGMTVKGVHNFSWSIQPRYRSLDSDLPEGTRIMARGPSGPSDIDYEAYQVARWALRCFEQCAIPITHPGGRGNYDVMPGSISFPGQSWPCIYIFQRLLDIAALHPASRQLPAFDPNTQLDELGAPEATIATVSTWTQPNQRLFLFCFRLHHALLDPNPSFVRPLATPFDWKVQHDLSIITDLPRATIALAEEPPSQRDLEALQVARWAIDLFSSHGIPITTPGGRGIWDALSSSRNPGDGWAYAHLLQRLLEVAALHPAGLHISVDTDDWSRDIPAELRAPVSNWGGGIKKLASFCFRLHGAFLGRFIEPDALVEAPMPISDLTTHIAGFPIGIYFEIRARGSNHTLKTFYFGDTDGVQIQLWPRPSGGDKLRAAAFFIDRTGALCHGSGLNVDIVDNIPVLRQRRPVVNPPNSWSHPLPRFYFVQSQIQIQFISDPALPSCSERLYPNQSWRNSQFVLARNSEQPFHKHSLTDFQPPRVPFDPLPHSDTDANHDAQWRIIVEPLSENTANERRTLWDIIPLI